VLISALREGVPVELRGSSSGLPPEALAAKLVRQLRDNLAFDGQAARWAVESWELALGIGGWHSVSLSEAFDGLPC